MATAPIAEATSCALENYLVLPDHSMDERIREAKDTLGKECVILGHHYQRDEVVRFADYRGDSYRLSQMAAQADGRYIVFCGVHFMAESADILAHDGQSVILQRRMLHGRHGRNRPGGRCLGTVRESRAH